MGPSILFDKSVIQSLGQEALQEVSRYFYTVVPPVLLMETLADLSLKQGDLEAARRKVAVIAKKVLPIDSIANADYRSMCIHNLLGEYVPMDRIPAVLGARPVTAKDGSKGMVIDMQPENEALLRWRSGMFNEDDMRFAIEWRDSAHGSNLEAIKQTFPKPPVKMQSLEQVGEFVRLLLMHPEFQESLLAFALGLLRCDVETVNRVRLRWKWDLYRRLESFAPYAWHCVRVQAIYYTGMIQGLFGTRPSNVVDLEYLYYTPFAFIFCSGDKLHRQLAPLILQGDQSFLDRQDLLIALNELVEARKGVPDVEPQETSLIGQLWRTHWNRTPSDAVRQQVSDEERERIVASLNPIIETLRVQEKRPGFRFPV